MKAGRLRVSMELLQQVLALPAGAVILDVKRGDFETVELLVVDDRFPVVPDGGEVPIVDLVASRVETSWVLREGE